MDKINFKEKRILVTGGSGYLGRNLIKKLLSLKALVYSLDINDDSQYSDVSYYNINLLDTKQLNNVIQEIQPSLIYHLAASIDRTRDFSNSNKLFENNLTGTVNLLNALKEFEYENLIFTSTSEVYGGNLIKTPFKEDDNFIPVSPYSLSKYCAEISIKTFSEVHHKNYTILRLFNFIGKGMSKKFFLPQLIDKLERNEDIDMTKGEQLRDFLHIEDILQALVLATTEKAYNEIFNVCSGQGNSIKDLALKLKKLFKSTSIIKFGALPYRENEIWEMVGDNTKIKEKLDFTPKLEIQDLLNEIYLSNE